MLVVVVGWLLMITNLPSYPYRSLDFDVAMKEKEVENCSSKQKAMECEGLQRKVQARTTCLLRERNHLHVSQSNKLLSLEEEGLSMQNCVRSRSSRFLKGWSLSVVCADPRHCRGMSSKAQHMSPQGTANMISCAEGDGPRIACTHID